MCYAIPGRVEAIDQKTITVNYFGEKKKAHNEFPDLKIGDYIYAQGGYVIQALEKKQAEEILSVWKETFFELQQADLRLSKIDAAQQNSSPLLKILDKAAEERPLKNRELLYLLQTEEKTDLELLYKTSNFLRCKQQGNSCCVHGIIEFSNYCGRNCRYCGISTHNKNVSRYRLSIKQISEIAYEAIEKYGFKALVLQSGEDPEYSIDQICKLIRKIKQKSSVLIIISIGEVGKNNLKKLYAAGARGILMRFETSNPALYEKLHPGKNLSERLKEIKAAYKLGYFVITGGLVGIPGQSWEDILQDISLTAQLHAEMFSFGPFIPHPDTPLANAPQATPDTILKTLAIARLAYPKEARILVTTAFETIDPEARRKGLLAGANSVMLNATPERFQKQYSIYPDRAHTGIELQKQISSTIDLLRNLGRAPSDLGLQ